MAGRIRSREISPLELVDAHLRQIDSMNPKINAFVSVLAEEARAAAANPVPGPLSGIPVTIKDSFDVAGLPTLSGSRLRRGHVAARDAGAVARLRAAGAIIVGKTNCPELLANYESDNHIIGRTNNPWDPERTAGGSSGGEAAAIASFCSAGGIGSDGGGSIRLPAHFCGICGLKPTPGRVSGAGHFPAMTHPGGLLGVAGPMARTARDLRLLFEVLAGYDPDDPFSAPVPLRQPEVSGVRIGVMEQFYQVPVQAAMCAAVQKAAGVLSGLGYPVEPFKPLGLERAPNLWSFFFTELAAVSTRGFFAGREAEVHWTGMEFFEPFRDAPAPEAKTILDNLAARDSMRAALLGQMQHFPVVLAPVCAVPAFRHRERRWETDVKPVGLFQAMMPLTWVNLLGLPAVTLPISRSEEGLPVGIQLIGRPYEEELLLELAVRMEAVQASM